MQKDSEYAHLNGGVEEPPPQRELSDSHTDDFFGDQGESNSSEEERRRREVEAIRRPHYTAGVREGVSVAHEANVQGGFDGGFHQGAKAATEPGFLYGATSMALAFYARYGCSARAQQPLQKLDDTGVPTVDLQALQSATLKLRADVRQLANDVDASIDSAHARRALSRVSLVQIPPDVTEVQATGAAGGDGREGEGGDDTGRG